MVFHFKEKKKRGKTMREAKKDVHTKVHTYSLPPEHINPKVETHTNKHTPTDTHNHTQTHTYSHTLAHQPTKYTAYQRFTTEMLIGKQAYQTDSLPFYRSPPTTDGRVLKLTHHHNGQVNLSPGSSQTHNIRICVFRTHVCNQNQYYHLC